MGVTLVNGQRELHACPMFCFLIFLVLALSEFRRVVDPLTSASLTCYRPYRPIQKAVTIASKILQ